MDRLLAGDKGTTDGKLTWTNVHLLAGVPKATANRAAEIKSEWKQKLQERKKLAKASEIATAPGVPGPEVVSRQQILVGLRTTIRIMANHIQVLFITVEDLKTKLRQREDTIKELQEQLAQATGQNIVTLQPRT
jgi:hypothetical protein